MSRIAGAAALLGLSLLGLGAFLVPVFRGSPSQPAEYTLLLSSAIVAGVALLLGLAVWSHRLSTRLLAVLAALAAIDAALRLTVVIGVGGFSPVFFLILAGGFALGPSFGFSLGALTLLLSAVITAGIGPWLPYQMLGAAWVGLLAGLAGLPFRSRPPTRLALAVLAVYGIAAGFAYGALLDLWDWPLLLPSATSSLGWAPHLAPALILRRFATFYLATSAVYDAFRAAGNAFLVVLLGGPVVAALLRFKRRFLVEWQPAADGAAVGVTGAVKMAVDAGGATARPTVDA
jgi:energy-coupling factor transport system substrate-specific component